MEQEGLKLDRETFSCPICLKLLKDPVTIPCGHTYCLICINTLWEGADNKTCSCPQCKLTITPRPALVKNTMLAALVEQLKKTSLHAAAPEHCFAGPGDVACDICFGRKKKALKTCMQCRISYCEEHLQSHYKVDRFKKHTLMYPRVELQDDICGLHDEVKKMFCRTDKQSICYLCSVDNHKGHDIVSTSTIMAERQRQLEETLQQRIQERENHVQLHQRNGRIISRTATEAVAALNSSAEKAVNDSERIFTDLMFTIVKRSNDMKDEIRARQKTEVERLKKHQQTLQKEIAELKREGTEAKLLLHMEDPGKFLHDYPPLSPLEPRADFSSTLPTHVVTEAVFDLRQKVDCIRDKWRIFSQKGTGVEVSRSQPEPKTRADVNKSQPEPKTRADVNKSQPEPKTRADVNKSQPEPKTRADVNKSQPEPKTRADVNKSQPEPKTKTNVKVSQSQPDPSTKANVKVSQSQPEPSTKANVKASQSQPEPSTRANVKVSQSQPEPSTRANVKVSQSQPEPSTKANVKVSQSQPEPSTKANVNKSQPEDKTRADVKGSQSKKKKKTKTKKGSPSQPEPKTRAEFLKHWCELTLDPNTSHKEMVISKRNTKVELMNVRRIECDCSHPDRFSRYPQVLSKEILTGRCYWEVEWEGEAVRIAVSYHDICRLGDELDCAFGENKNSWALYCNEDYYEFAHNQIKTRITTPPFSRIGVYLDYTAGVLAFYEVSDTMTLIHRVQTKFTKPLYAGLCLYDYEVAAEFCNLK